MPWIAGQYNSYYFKCGNMFNIGVHWNLATTTQREEHGFYYVYPGIKSKIPNTDLKKVKLDSLLSAKRNLLLALNSVEEGLKEFNTEEPKNKLPVRKKLLTRK